MEYLYITLNRQATQYAISLDEILVTLYGLGKRSISRPKLTSRESLGIVYRVQVTPEQHENVRNILCDFLMDSHVDKLRFKKAVEEFCSEDFVKHILKRAGVTEPKYEVIFQGDLKEYVAEAQEVKHKSTETQNVNSNIKKLNRIEENEKVMKDGTAQYEYVPHKMEKLVAAD